MNKVIYILAFLGLLGGDSSTDLEEKVKFFLVESSSKELSISRGQLNYQDEAFHGYLVEYFENNTLKAQTPYVDGKKQGKEFIYYPGGQLYETRTYNKGNKIGIHKGWWEDGKQRFQYQFNAKGDYHGNCQEWFSNGELFRDFNYREGQEVGQQRMYNNDGSLRANYIIKNNRKYGLQGRKKCVPASNTGN